MQWTDEGIILSVRKFSEHAALVCIFTPKHGIYGGITKSAFSKSSRGIFQPGNLVQARWQARLPEHAGTWNVELITPIAAHIMNDRLSLLALASACALLEQVMHEREPHPELYARFSSLVKMLTGKQEWQPQYALLERDILAYCGFGLDLTQCAVTGMRENLIYVSPRSGRAVCTEAGAPYAAKLFSLPSFLRESGGFYGISSQEVLDGLMLTGYFLENHLFAPRGVGLPPARERFLRCYKREEEKMQTSVAWIEKERERCGV